MSLAHSYRDSFNLFKETKEFYAEIEEEKYTDIHKNRANKLLEQSTIKIYEEHDSDFTFETIETVVKEMLDKE